MTKILIRNIRSGKRQVAIVDLASIVRKEIEEIIDNQVKVRLLEKHRNVVKDWESNIDFQSKKFISADKIEISIFPTGADKQVWGYVDKGTKPHQIQGNPLLIFPWGGTGSYKAKTASIAKTVSGGGKVQNAQIVAAQSVNHPGSEARKFTETFAEEEKPLFQRDVENAFRRTVDKVKE